MIGVKNQNFQNWILALKGNKTIYKVIFGKSRLKFARELLLPVFLKFQNSITLAKNNIFWSGKKHLVAGVALYHKQHKVLDFDHPQVGDPPGPLN